MELYGCKVIQVPTGCRHFFLVPILISVEHQSIQLLASPEIMRSWLIIFNLTANTVCLIDGGRWPQMKGSFFLVYSVISHAILMNFYKSYFFSGLASILKIM